MLGGIGARTAALSSLLRHDASGHLHTAEVKGHAFSTNSYLTFDMVPRERKGEEVGALRVDFSDNEAQPHPHGEPLVLRGVHPAV
uniref:Uncharacterized protein n=1 Tax=Paramormyrops kingsleyae TaxID=1676925 RepID=A0A3B3SYB5_9TELE